jgi:hypothetical protein
MTYKDDDVNEAKSNSEEEEEEPKVKQTKKKKKSKIQSEDTLEMLMNALKP